MDIRLAVALIALVSSGCATIAGVDQFTEGQCAGGCDGAAPVDASNDNVAKDSTTSDSGSTDTSTNDAPTTDAGSDVVEVDCGALDTVLNCSACGASCDVLHSNGATCNGATCAYASCHSGYSDCNTTAPNVDGCECNTPSCCGNGCQTTHDNGIGENYYDCTAKGTYDQPQATEACAAYTQNQALCSASTCTGGGANHVVCGTANNVCVCWNFQGSIIGHVYSSGTAACYCPGTTDPSWN